ncbi:Uncharacterized protein DBV15_07946 [Temnothorax longispinosus]|uniref:Uncharacterized protein n=1 Tax=Temnothorax longispinosus TaxID=300112 RepID=A0A4S2KRG2_9HYME|nr:Uncharacterized protein DBV15_07946 [Temnothorax longispinosus]
MILVTIVAIDTRNAARFNIDSRDNAKLRRLEGRRLVKEDRRSTLGGKQLIASDVVRIFGNDTAWLSCRLLNDNAPSSLLLFPLITLTEWKPAIHLDNRYRLMRHEPMLDADGNETDQIGEDC